jgi:hypothetical protein
VDRDRGRRKRRARGHFLLDRQHQRLGLRRPALRFEPARGLGQALAQVPHDERADPGNDEHRPPSEGRDDQVAEQRGRRKARDDQERHESEPAPAGLRRHELGQRRIADNDLGAEAHPLHEAAGDELVHVLRERRRERGEPEDEEIELVGEAPAEPVAQEAGDEPADRHADQRERDEL